MATTTTMAMARADFLADVKFSSVLPKLRIEELSLVTANGDVLDSVSSEKGDDVTLLDSVSSEGARKLDTETKAEEIQTDESARDGKELSTYFFSNMCAKIAFDILANGAEGAPRDNLLFHSRGKPIDLINEVWPYTIDFFTETGKASGPTIRISGAVWSDSSTPLKTGFQTVLREFFRAELRQLDGTDKEQMRTQVNEWFKEQAGGLLEDPFGSPLVKAQHIGYDTRLIVATALRFDGEWFEPFLDAGVRDFARLDGTKVQVPFMTSYGRHYVQQFKGFKLLSVPFKQHKATNFSMLFYLPDDIDSTGDLRRFIGEHETVIQDVYFPEDQVQVGDFLIPKFSVRMRGPLPLNFSFDQMADSSRRLVSPAGLLSNFLEVNEKGVTAAAGTAFFIKAMPRARIIDDRFSRMGRKLSIDFVANRPFFFFIRDNRFGRMLFSGGLINPVGEATSFEPSDPTELGPEWLETIADRPEDGPEWLETIAYRSNEDPEWLETLAAH